MVTYLSEGWYTKLGQRRLCDGVVDGAIDTASMLFRSSVPPEAITSLALKIRTLATLVDAPHRRSVSSGLAPRDRAALKQRLQLYTDRYPALQCFVNDCLEHVNDGTELRALYLHLVHVTQMMQLLMVAKLSGAAGGLLSGPLPAAARTAAVSSEPTQPIKRASPKKARPTVAKKTTAKKKAAPAKKAAKKSGQNKTAPGPAARKKTKRK